jgi:hypothetical protein
MSKDQVIDTINRLFVSTDRRDWPSVVACFTDTVHFDMSSAGAGPPVQIRAQEIAGGWKNGLAAIEAIHHQAGNYSVDVTDDRATAFCYGIALHYRRTKSGKNTRTFVGSYDFTLRREAGGLWKIDTFKFNLKFIDGNAALEQEP